MIRSLIVTCLVGLSITATYAQSAAGDYECLSDQEGPDTYHGTMRVETDGTYGWLDPATATIGQIVPMQLLADGQVILGQHFAEHVVPGSFFLTGWFNESTFSYEASIATTDRVLDVVCTYVY